MRVESINEATQKKSAFPPPSCTHKREENVLVNLIGRDDMKWDAISLGLFLKRMKVSLYYSSLLLFESYFLQRARLHPPATNLLGCVCINV